MTLGRLKIDGFLVAIVVAVLAAATAPSLGAHGGIFHVDRLATVAVMLVFFLHGAILPLESLRRGLSHLRLHIVVQITAYGAFPLIGAAALLIPDSWVPRAVAIGFFFMSTVSSTISSSVAMTALAGGDVSGALFNATLSGILGVFITPAYASLVAQSVGVSLSLSSVLQSVALKVLLPLLLGQALRPMIWSFLERRRQLVQMADRGSIVLIVYGAFCDSVSGGVWTRDTLFPVVVSVLLSALILVTVSAVLILLIQLARLERASAIAAYFCGSQKSLANGLPIAHAVFAGSPALGLIVMPLLVYHQVQLAFGALVARRLSQRMTHE